MAVESVPVNASNGVSPVVFPAIVGSVDAGFLVERISCDARNLFGLSTVELVGAPLLDIVAADYALACLRALASACATQTMVSLELGLAGAQKDTLLVQAGFLPLPPAPSCAFVFLPPQEGWPLRLGADSTRNSDEFGGLTSRESEIVARLLDGYRVPAIAAKLFLSQSTVRNHLASVFIKRGVRSQQQLVDSFR